MGDHVQSPRDVLLFAFDAAPSSERVVPLLNLVLSMHRGRFV